MQFVLKVLVATTMVHVFIYTPYMNQLITQVNQISFKYQKLACYLYWLILTVNNVSLEVGTWVGGKAVPCTVPAFDMTKLTDPLKDQMPLYFQSVENKLHERK